MEFGELPSEVPRFKTERGTLVVIKGVVIVFHGIHQLTNRLVQP